MISDLEISAGSRITQFEKELARCPTIQMELNHSFIHDPELGTILYVRSCVLPAGSCWTTKIHRKAHPFQISEGLVRVIDSHGNAIELCAPYSGVTEPNTRRAIHVLKRTVWTTYHMTNTTDLKEIERQLIVPHDIPETADGRSCLPENQPIIYISPSLNRPSIA